MSVELLVQPLGVQNRYIHEMIKELFSTDNHVFWGVES